MVARHGLEARATKMRRILVIEDDSAIRRGIVDALRFKGYDPIEAANGKDGMTLAQGVDCDLVLLDLVLPGPGGLEILSAVRASRPTLPVIILTAKGEENDRVAGLSGGADDYVVKPFSVKELLARVEAVLRRSPERPTDLATVSFPGGVADLRRAEVRFNNGGRGEQSERQAPQPPSPPPNPRPPGPPRPSIPPGRRNRPAGGPDPRADQPAARPARKP